MLLIKQFEEGCWDKQGTITIKDGICHVCEQGKPVLAIDNSDCEYGDGMICLDCIQNSFKEYKEICKKRGLKRAEAISNSKEKISGPVKQYKKYYTKGE
jgi:hypothetical protein